MTRFRIAIVFVLSAVLWVGSTAEAATPTTNTTYKGDGVKLIVKNDNHKIAKAIIRYDIFGTPYKNTIKDITVKNNGHFSKSEGGGLLSITGKFTSKHKAKGSWVAGEYGDMFKKGIVDARKVTRSALQNAASIAAMVLTTETLITDIPEKQPAGAGGGHGHGCPDMDF